MFTSGVHLSDTFRYFYSLLGGGLKSKESQQRLTVVLGFGPPYISYRKLLHLLLVCTSLTLSGISTLARRASELSEVSAETYICIRIWHSLYTLQEVIVFTSDVHLSDTFRYFYSLPGRDLNSLGSQLRLTVVLGFGNSYISFQKLMCQHLVCTCLIISGISTLSQEGVSNQ